MGIRMTNGLPKESEENGLIDIARELLKEPLRRIPVVGVVDCSKITTDTTTGAREATVRVLRLEAVHPDDRLELERIIRRSLEWRRGDEVLPIDLERDLEAWFPEGTTVDLETGELRVPGETAAEPDRAGTLFDDGADEQPPAEGEPVEDDEPVVQELPKPSLQALTWAAEVVLEQQKAHPVLLAEAIGISQDEAEGLLLVLAAAGVLSVTVPGAGKDGRAHFDVLVPPSQIGHVRRNLAAMADDPTSRIYEHLSRPGADEAGDGA